MTSRPSFRQIATPLDVSDAALEKLNERLGVPALVTPAARRAESVEKPAQDVAKPAAAPSPARKADKRVTAAPAARPSRKEVRMAVEVPEYLRDAVNVRAATERCTARHLVMQGLLALGFEIDPADLMVDGRQQPDRR